VLRRGAIGDCSSDGGWPSGFIAVILFLARCIIAVSP
jgi:hypothetical protein